MFGFGLPENFRYPYASASVAGFWQRWNITLLGWFREYVYSPLRGRNPANNDIIIRNSLAAWLLVGLWHGRGVTMVFFGAWFFLLLLAEHFTEFRSIEGFSVLKRLYTLFSVMMGWVLLRAEDLYHAGRYYMNLFGLNHNAFINQTTYVLLRENLLLLSLGILACTPVTQGFGRLMQDRNHAALRGAYHFLYAVFLCAVFLLSLLYILYGAFNRYSFLL